MRRGTALSALVLAAAIAALASASPALGGDDTQITNAFRGALQNRASKSPDERLFVEKCGMCHRQMGMGTVILARRMDSKEAMLEAREDLTAETVIASARMGIGNMPRISRGEVSDTQLARIAAYLAREKGQ